MISKFILGLYVMPYMSIFGIEPSLECAEDEFLNLIRKYRGRDDAEEVINLCWDSENERLSNWLDVLVNLSIEEGTNYLEEFLKIDNLCLSDKNYKDDIYLPKVLQSYFKTKGTVCHFCGGILVNREYGYDDEEDGIHYEASALFCCNCGFRVDDVSDLSLHLGWIPELKNLSERVKHKLENYSFEYIHRLDNRVVIKILNRGSSVGYIDIIGKGINIHLISEEF